MPSTPSESSVEDKIGRKKKKKGLQPNENEIQPDTDVGVMKKERLQSKRRGSLPTILSDGQIDQTSHNQNFNSDESNQQSSLLVDEQPAVCVKKKKKKKKRISEDSKSLSISQDLDECENAPESPVVFENKDNKEKKKKRKKKRKEGDTNEERKDSGDEETHDNETRAKNKKKTMEDEKEYVDSVRSDHSFLSDVKNDGEGDSVSTIVSDDKKDSGKKKKKKHKEKEKSSPDLTTSGKHENATEGDDECNTPGLKIKKKKKKRKREEQESDSVCKAEEEQEVKVKSGKKKKKKRENDHGNSIDSNDSQSSHSQTDLKPDMFRHAVFESAKREGQFSRVTGKPSKMDDDGDRNKLNSSSKADDTEDKSLPLRGQWQGALFENEERQSKFLRLLGGMKSAKGDKKTLFPSQNSSQKKGLYGSLNLNSSSDNTAANTKGGNALCVSDAAEINKRLEEDYNKAMNFKLSGSKGAGLGFAPDPAEGKKFHIDANSTKSIKFDNDDD